jgi:hypothetical protein
MTARWRLSDGFLTSCHVAQLVFVAKTRDELMACWFD